MKLPRLRWYWHVLIVVVLLVVTSAVAIWFNLGNAVYAPSDFAK